jgi:hypothetical protein
MIWMLLIFPFHTHRFAFNYPAALLTNPNVAKTKRKRLDFNITVRAGYFIVGHINKSFGSILSGLASFSTTDMLLT